MNQLAPGRQAVHDERTDVITDAILALLLRAHSDLVEGRLPWAFEGHLAGPRAVAGVVGLEAPGSRAGCA